MYLKIHIVLINVYFELNIIYVVYLGDDLDNQICRAYTKVWIPGWKEYIIKVAQEFVYEIDDYGLCNVPLLDYTENIRFV